MNPKVIILIIFFVLLNSAQAAGFIAIGFAAGNIDEFNSGYSIDKPGQATLVIDIDSRNSYMKNGTSFQGSFDFVDPTGGCTTIPNMRAVLDLSDISSNPAKKTMYSMLMGAYLLKRPVKLTLAGCMQIYSGADAAKIVRVSFIN